MCGGDDGSGEQVRLAWLESEDCKSYRSENELNVKKRDPETMRKPGTLQQNTVQNDTV